MIETHSPIVFALIVEWNIGACAAFIIFVWLCVRFEGLRGFVKNAIENGDDKAHHEDANKALVLAFAICCIWLFGNVVLLSLYYGPNGAWYTIIGIISALILGLLGLKKFQ